MGDSPVNKHFLGAYYAQLSSNIDKWTTAQITGLFHGEIDLSTQRISGLDQKSMGHYCPT